MIRNLLQLFLIALSLYSCDTKRLTCETLISDITIIDLNSGAIIPHQQVIINGDSIAAIQDEAPLDLNPIQTIDGTRQFLLPGFWDNHIHLRGGDSLIAQNRHLLQLYLANGVTSVRDAGGDLTTSVKKWQQAIADNELIGPTIYTSGPKIDGPQAHWAGSLEVTNDEDIRRALDSLQSLNVDFVKLYDSTISAENYLNAIKATEERGMITSGHMPFTVTLDEAIEAGIDGIEHLYYILKGASVEEKGITDEVKTGTLNFWSSLDQVMQTYNEETAGKVFSKLKEDNVYVIPTLHIGHTLSHLDENDHQNDAYLDYIGDGIIETYEGRLKSATNASDEFKVMRKKLDAAFVKLAEKLNEADVQLLAGSDAGAYNSFVYPGISLHKELEALVNAGLSPLEALQSSSQNGARFLKKEVPEVKVGAQADLVILEANPLEDIKNTTKINHVFKSGRHWNKEALQNLLKSDSN